MTEDIQPKRGSPSEQVGPPGKESDLWYGQVVAARREAERLRTELDALRRTKTFRYTAPARKAFGALRRRLPGRTNDTPSERSYQEWVQAFDIVTDDDRSGLLSRINLMRSPTTFSVVMPVYNTPRAFLQDAIESVLGQIYPYLELCIADDSSSHAHVRDVLKEYMDRDPRVKIVYRTTNGHISAATTSALDISTGDWVVFLDHDDKLAEHALALLAMEIDRDPSLKMIYSDEDHLDPSGQRSDPMFKSDFDPVRLLASNYVCHLLAARREEVLRVGGVRVGLEGSQDYDLVLRLTEGLDPATILHIPRILYHWRAHKLSTASSHSAKTYAADTSRRAVVDHLDRTKRHGDVVTTLDGSYQRVRWCLPDPPPLVSVIVPTRDGEHLASCLESLLRRTSYRPYEVLVMDNGSKRADVVDYLDSLTNSQSGQVRVMKDPRPFNYSALNNAAVDLTSGEIVCLLNDDTQVVSDGWLDELVSQVLQPQVAAVGAKLYYADGRVQHAGMALGVGGGAGHLFRYALGSDPGYMGGLVVPRSVSSVTGACMVVRREAWDAAGGLDEISFPVSFNDVDLCLRLQDMGWRVVWSPFAELVHVESASRGADVELANLRRWIGELAAFQARWGRRLPSDPYYNPNLTLDSGDCSLAWPPRVEQLTGPAVRREE